MKKKLTIVIMILIMAFTCLFNFVACKPDSTTPTPTPDPSPSHTHSFGEQWLNDDDYHWHKCTGCDDTDEKKPHIWGTGEIIQQPGCGTTGTTKYTCTECGREKN